MSKFGSFRRLSEKFINIKAGTSEHDFGEVFTPENIVKDMLDLVPSDAMTLDKTALEPSCGSGNFLVELLARRFAQVDMNNFDRDVLRALGGIYAIDIQPDNVLESRYRLFTITDNFYKSKGLTISESQMDAIEEVICKNIILANTLTDKMIRMNNLGVLCNAEFEPTDLTLATLGVAEYYDVMPLLENGGTLKGIKVEAIKFTDWETKTEDFLNSITQASDMSYLVASLFG